MDRLVSALNDAEPPVYATQGEDVGKRRGRRKTVQQETPDPPAKRRRVRAHPKGEGGKGRKKKAISHAQTRKGFKGEKQNGKRKTKKSKKTAKARAVEAYKAELANGRDTALRSRTVPTPVRAAPSSSKRKKITPNKCEEGTAPPEHITPHHVYSSAYKKCLAAGHDKPAARQQAREASEYFKTTGLVDDRCGTFRQTRRVDNGVPRPAKAG